VTLLNSDDDWASQVFSEQELLKLRKQLQQIEEDHVASQEAAVVSIETEFDRSFVHEILRWLRDQHPASEGIIAGLLWALGCNICFRYLTDTEWEYDEELSDHATYFGARMFLDDQEDEDDDVDDDDVDGDDDES
jgi:hypothetical protein